MNIQYSVSLSGKLKSFYQYILYVESDIQSKLNMPGAKQNQQKREQSSREQSSTPPRTGEGYIVTAEHVRKMWADCSKDRQKSEIACTWYVAGKTLMWATKTMMGEQADLWRDLKRQGKLTILPGNNVARQDKRGRTWNMLVVQTTDINESPPADVVALLEFGFMVSGYVYFFKTAENRDIIYRYIMEI